MECCFIWRRMLFSSFFSAVVWQGHSADLKADYFNRMSGFVIGECLYCTKRALSHYLLLVVMQRAQSVKRISHSLSTWMDLFMYVVQKQEGCNHCGGEKEAHSVKRDKTPGTCIACHSWPMQ